MARHGRGGLALTRGPKDDEDTLGRAGRRSRPRSRLRPAHAEAQHARVVTVDRGRYGCLLDDGTVVVAMRARELADAASWSGTRSPSSVTSPPGRTLSCGSCAWRSGGRCCVVRRMTATRSSGSLSRTPTRWSWCAQPPSPSRSRGWSTGAWSRRRTLVSHPDPVHHQGRPGRADAASRDLREGRRRRDRAGRARLERGGTPAARRAVARPRHGLRGAHREWASRRW